MPLHQDTLPPSPTGIRFKPAVVTVGDELVFGERSNDNQQWLLQTLQERGCPAELALILPDSIAIIAAWLQTLLGAHCFPVLISGGLGGTHDDCTREGIATALRVPLTRHHHCFEMLAAKYEEQFTAGRQRMAMLPEGCELIPNPVGAPGFFLAGVYAFPGFPKMLQPMVNQVLDSLLPNSGKEGWQVREYLLRVSEGMIAYDIEQFVRSHPEARIGLYPHAERFPLEVTVRLRYKTNDPDLPGGFDELLATIKRKHQLE
jgi:molybdopterin-biosynthesis enzyme MoeA-like protein